MTLRILIVDDVKTCREYLRGLLKDHEVTEASSGEEALGLYTPLTDLVFMDILMPGMSGQEAAVKLRCKFPSVYIVAVTSEKAENLRWNLFDGYIQKPYTAAEITRHLTTFRHELDYRESRRCRCEILNCIGRKYVPL